MLPSNCCLQPSSACILHRLCTPYCRLTLTHRLGHLRRTRNADTAAFHKQNNMDFNKWINHGIPYLSTAKSAPPPCRHIPSCTCHTIPLHHPILPHPILYYTTVIPLPHHTHSPTHPATSHPVLHHCHTTSIPYPSTITSRHIPPCTIPLPYHYHTIPLHHSL